MKNLTTVVLLTISVNSYAGSLLNKEQQLGERLFSDKNLSLNKNQACASCHSLSPARAKAAVTKRVPGFVDPDNVRTGSAVSDGSIRGLTGSLNAPSVGYAAYSPEFHWDGDNEEGLYIGGQFWNGRASNLSEQAKMPFLNPVEMAMPDEWAVVSRIKQDKTYVRLFRDIYSLNLNDIADSRKFTAYQSEKVTQVFQSAATAISAYEQSPVFNKFNSKFDYVLAGKTQFTTQEAKGFDIFNGKGNCAACHISEAAFAEDGSIEPPVFTDFSYDNIGLPRNVNIPGNHKPNPGLGGRNDLKGHSAANELGKHKVMSLRNIALTAPYGHNGSMATLDQIVRFYNTRDTLGYVDDINHPGFGKTGWPEPEFSDNLNQEELGNLGLNTEEENALVAFLKTLTDDYPKWGRDRRVPPWSPSPFTQPLKPNRDKHSTAQLK